MITIKITIIIFILSFIARMMFVYFGDDCKEKFFEQKQKENRKSQTNK